MGAAGIQHEAGICKGMFCPRRVGWARCGWHGRSGLLTGDGDNARRPRLKNAKAGCFTGGGCRAGTVTKSSPNPGGAQAWASPKARWRFCLDRA